MFVHNFDPVLVDLHFIEIRWYSLAYIFGIIFGWMYAKKIIRKIRHNNALYYLKIDDFEDAYLELYNQLIEKKEKILELTE